MTVLLLKLAGPLQSWGDGSRYTRRLTRYEPTKSGVIGMIASAMGRQRCDSIEDLNQLKFGVRVDQPGKIVRDFHTAIRTEKTGRQIKETSMPLSERFYLSDAVFIAALEGSLELIEQCVKAFNAPAYPLYLGRRSCVPSIPPFLNTVEEDLETVLRSLPWHASDWYKSKMEHDGYRAELIVDTNSSEGSGLLKEEIQDVPRSFDPQLRQYGWRTVIHDYVELLKPRNKRQDHDPMEVLRND